MIVEVLTIIAILWIYLDFVYPYVVYRYKAYCRGAGMPHVMTSRPFGIPFTIRMINAIKQQNFVSLITENHLKMSVRTFIQESTFKWVVYTRDPENLKAVLSTQFNDFSVEERSGVLTPIFGSGIFTQDGNKWKHSRSMLRPQFSKDQISRLESVLAHLDHLIAKIDQQQKQEGYVNILQLFHMFTMDTATEFLFGKSVNSLQFDTSYAQANADADADKVKGNSDKVKGKVTTHRGEYVCTTKSGRDVYTADFVDSYTFLNEFAIKKFMLNSLSFALRLLQPDYPNHIETARAFIDFYVENALQSFDKDEDRYVFSYELAKETKDPIVIRDQIFNILIAGRDTTASTLTFAFYYFALLPDTWKKCHEEVCELYENESITYESLRKLKYVHMFIKEVLRLHPIVPVNTRTATRDTTLPRGAGPNQDKPVLVPKGTALNYSVYVMHRDESIYGPDSLIFNPERWDPETRSVNNNAMYTWGYLPFNGGPRICLGQQFALTELALTIVKLALTYRFVDKAESFPAELKQRNTLTLVVGGDGLPIKFIK